MFSRPADQIRIFFCADIHGSERCFRKWLNAAKAYKCDVLVFGGDLAGKILQPIVDLGAGRYRSDLYGRPIDVEGDAALGELREQIRNAGRYDIVVTRGALSRMIEMEVFVDGTFVCHVKADGLIVATWQEPTVSSLASRRREVRASVCGEFGLVCGCARQILGPPLPGETGRQRLIRLSGAGSWQAAEGRGA